MTPAGFHAAICDIELNLEPGEAYTLDVQMANKGGLYPDRAWRVINAEVIALEKPDWPVLYVALEHVASINLSGGGL